MKYSFIHHVIIIDSNNENRKWLHSFFLSFHKDIKIVGEYHSVEKYLEDLEKFKGLLIIEKKQLDKINNLDFKKFKIIITGPNNDIQDAIDSINRYYAISYFTPPFDKLKFKLATSKFMEDDNNLKMLEQYDKLMEEGLN